jgi:hypothetical protein
MSERPMMRHNAPPNTPGRKVAGWVIIFFTIIPLAMAAHDEGSSYLWLGGVALAIGVTLALWPSHKGRSA